MVLQASATWDKFRKERDFHRMHHKRVAQEKNKLLHDMQVLKKHYSMVSAITQTMQMYLCFSSLKQLNVWPAMSIVSPCMLFWLSQHVQH